MSEGFNLSKWVHEDFKESDMNMVEDIWVKEGFQKVKELTKSFIHGDNPPHFSINEDNIDEYFEEINRILGDKLI